MVRGDQILNIATADDDHLTVEDYSDCKVLIVNGHAIELTLHEAEQLAQALDE